MCGCVRSQAFMIISTSSSSPPVVEDTHCMDSASVNLNSTLGVLQIGVLATYVLFGVVTAQAYIYYSRFPDDSPKLKALVAFIWVCEVAGTLCLGHTIYTYTISDYMRPEVLSQTLPSLAVATFFESIVEACVQGFFAYRIYAFAKTIYIPILIWIMTLLQLLGCTVTFVKALHMIALARFEADLRWLLLSMWSLISANDLLITVSLVTVLITRRTYAQKRTLTLVNKLVVWTIETGMLTSLMAILILVCVCLSVLLVSADLNVPHFLKFMAMKDNLIWLALTAIESKMYSNSFLASLNSRTTLRALNEVSLPSLNFVTATQSPSVNVVIVSTHDVDGEESALGHGDKVALGSV
ncbi:hypothetical protein MVEN_01339000 [Mycena venus]|uniref:DUF6534 domain-containing protein n=1 Tax=Mycena venus TaxID=2733690 RepID=A0A8H6XXY4_9AGAR|nr:hypothetical protein MVEN_01339000 [Mycena venus]